MASVSKFRHQDVSEVPPGFRVRTIRAGKHELKIAFPKGARKKGSGKIVSILHPKAEKNPACAALPTAEIAGIEIPVAAASSPYLSAAIKELIEPSTETISANPVDIAAQWNKLREGLAAWIAPKKGVGNPKGDVQEIGGSKYTLSTSYTDRMNVRYELYKQLPGSEGKGAIIVRDMDAGQVIHNRVYSTFEKAKYEYKRTISIAKKNPGKRNYTEQIRTSSGQTVYVDVVESGGRWMAEGYPVVKGKSRRVGHPMIAYGDTEARAYDNLVEKLDRNPRRKKGKRNLDEIDKAARLTERFRGFPAEQITESGEPNKMRDDFAHLGWSEQFVFVPASFHEELDCDAISEFYDAEYQRTGNSEKSWREVEAEFGIPVMVYDVAGDEIRLVASADGKQLYLLGGKQAAFEEFLPDFNTDTNKDRVDLGWMLCLTYSAQKVQAGDTEERGYYHVFGEEGGYPPGCYFDKLNKRLCFFGGTYHLEDAEAGIRN